MWSQKLNPQMEGALERIYRFLIIVWEYLFYAQDNVSNINCLKEMYGWNH